MQMNNIEDIYFSKKKRNRNELIELTSNDYKMYEQNQFNTIKENAKSNSKCSIF